MIIILRLLRNGMKTKRKRIYLFFKERTLYKVEFSKEQLQAKLFDTTEPHP
jgi:hypothetical protein